MFSIDITLPFTQMRKRKATFPQEYSTTFQKFTVYQKIVTKKRVQRIEKYSEIDIYLITLL